MRRRLALAILVALTVQSVQAADTADLYRAETVVTGTEEPERTRGFRIGLADVVVRLTGDARLADDQRLRPLLQEPHRFVEAFEYEDRMKGIPVHDEQGTRERPHYLRMLFKPAEIDRQLARLDLTIWPTPRPMLAVWLGIRTAADRYVLAASGPKGYGQRAVIVETAKRRGIPVWLPSTQSVTFDDIAASDPAKLISASPRADARLTGVLSITPDGYWDIAWRFTWQARSRAWSLRRVSFDTALKNGLQTAALVLSGNAPM